MASNVLRLSLAYLFLIGGVGKVAAFAAFRASLLRWPLRSFRQRSAAAAGIIALEVMVTILLFLAIPSATAVGLVAAIMGVAFLLDGVQASRSEGGQSCHCMGFGQPRSSVTVARSCFVLIAGAVVGLLGGDRAAPASAHALGLAIAAVMAFAPAAVPAPPSLSRRVP